MTGRFLAGALVGCVIVGGLFLAALFDLIGLAGAAALLIVVVVLASFAAFARS